jgi:magnesium-transporting ATPase (P-type)
MKNLVKIIFFIFWLFSIILAFYMFYITFSSTDNLMKKWGFGVMYLLTLIASTLLTYNVIFTEHYHEE